MNRRDLLNLSALAAIEAGMAKFLPAQPKSQPMPQQVQDHVPPAAPAQEPGKADIVLEIAPVTVELAPNRIISTIGYNGSSPGPILRMREGVPVTVDVINDTETAELVHWHGLLIPAEVDGAEEEGTPLIPPHKRRRFKFTPRPAGTRWYHTHAMSNGDLHRGSYTGQFGFLIIENANNPGRYDQELFLALRDWEPFFTNAMDDDDDDPRAPHPEKPTTLDTRPNGLEVASALFSINDKALGVGDPIRVKPGQRVLVHLLNASAIENKRVAFPGHLFQIVALDGNPVPIPQTTEAIFIGPGERVDAIVEMNQPGVWILGATNENIRNAGLGIVVEYANRHDEPRWTPPKSSWDYTLFGRPAAQPAPDRTIEMVFEKIPSGAGKFNRWLVNGKEYPHENEFVLERGKRHRLIFRNRTDDAHPLHLHRHLFELVDLNGKATGGIIKDTIVVPFYGRATVDFVADQPGPALFHCHIQQHMDFGFKALFRYS